MTCPSFPIPLRSLLGVTTTCLFSSLLLSAEDAEWSPTPVNISSQWAQEVTPENAWQSYPRPQLVRGNWTNLNGLWDYQVTALDQVEKPVEWDGKILVPFGLESSLSGVGRLLEKTEALWYHRDFEHSSLEGRLLLNFEAVDYASTIWLNGQEVGKNTGGNLPFSIDITEAVKEGNNELVLRVEDFASDGGKYQLRGKQQRKGEKIWYTPVSGIWQTVWLEAVPHSYIESLKIETQLEPAMVSVKANITGRVTAGQSVRVTLRDGDKVVAKGKSRQQVLLAVPDAEYWSPAHPKLYDLQVELLDAAGEVIESVTSYTGIREVGEKRGEDGSLAFTLNGEEIFHWGPLDQGWWPSGLLTPPSEKAMQFDVDYLKAAGFNMIRKHIKVEPRLYYAYCDRVGILLWQDQVSGGNGSEWPKEWIRLQQTKTVPDAEWPQWAHDQYMAELKGMVDHLYNHPSIVCWVPFNERWGQHRTMEVGRWIVDYDPSRHINIASGGNFHPIGDIADSHAYPHPRFPMADERYHDYLKVVGEFGGHGFPVEGHQWQKDGANWGYGGLPKNKEEFKARLEKSFDLLQELKKKGLAGAVYTQTTDVETELNGLITYDRKVIKVPADEFAVESSKFTGEE